MAPPTTTEERICRQGIRCRHRGLPISIDHFRKGDTLPHCYLFHKTCNDCRSTGGRIAKAYALPQRPQTPEQSTSNSPLHTPPPHSPDLDGLTTSACRSLPRQREEPATYSPWRPLKPIVNFSILATSVTYLRNSLRDLMMLCISVPQML
jgi:hypothetical protein